MKKPSNDFWVTNVSNRNVSLSDLAINIPAYRTINLMDTKHYKYTLEQLQKSAESGSIFAKRDKIRVRMLDTKMDIKSGRFIDHSVIETKMTNNINLNDENGRKNSLPSRERSILIIKEDKYEELQVSDEEFASENADMDLQK